MYAIFKKYMKNILNILSTYKMKKLITLPLLMIALTACCQTDQTFNKPIYANAGIYFLDGTFLNTALSGGQADWNTMINKPLTFPPAVHNHDLLYKPIGYAPTWAELTGKPATFPPSAHTTAWTDITGKPTEIELIDELAKLSYLPIPSKTTTAINATIVPKGIGGIVRDTTLKPPVYKYWDGSGWSKIAITNQ
jgi:hypothetical protein